MLNLVSKQEFRSISQSSADEGSMSTHQNRQKSYYFALPETVVNR